jgi:RHS repeat-associated protein
VVALLDQNGNPFAAYRYDAWGNPLGEGNVGAGIWAQATVLGETTVISAELATEIAQLQVLRYASYCYDSESGMYYLSARHYDPATRQFLSKDLSRNDGEQSAYQYCGGNPVRDIDPTGYKPRPRRADIKASEEQLERAYAAYTQWLYDHIKIVRDCTNASNWLRQKFANTNNPLTKLLCAGGDIVVGALRNDTVTLTAVTIGTGSLTSRVAMEGLETAAEAATVTTRVEAVTTGVNNPVPDILARVIPGNGVRTTLGRPGAPDVFATAADDIAGLNAAQIPARLGIPESKVFTVIEFPSLGQPIASPISRLNPGFFGRGLTSGGAREFVIPNGPIPADAVSRVVN